MTTNDRQSGPLDTRIGFLDVQCGEDSKRIRDELLANRGFRARGVTHVFMGGATMYLSDGEELRLPRGYYPTISISSQPAPDAGAAGGG